MKRKGSKKGKKIKGDIYGFFFFFFYLSVVGSSDRYIYIGKEGSRDERKRG